MFGIYLTACEYGWLSNAGHCYIFRTGNYHLYDIAQSCAVFDAYPIVFETTGELEDIMDITSQISNVSINNNTFSSCPLAMGPP